MSRANGNVHQLRQDALVGRSLRKRLPAIERRIGAIVATLVHSDPDCTNKAVEQSLKDLVDIRNSLAAAMQGGKNG